MRRLLPTILVVLAVSGCAADPAATLQGDVEDVIGAANGRDAAGGEATTVLRAAAVPVVAVPVVDRTSVLPQTRVAPQPTRAETTLPPRRTVAAAPRRSPWPVVLLLLAVLAAGIAGVLYAQSQGGSTGPLPAVNPDLPPELRDPLQRLKDSVDA